MNLKVIKSHMGQYITPFNNVGNKSLFNRATISVPVSPELGNNGNYLETLLSCKLQKAHIVNESFDPQSEPCHLNSGKF